MITRLLTSKVAELLAKYPIVSINGPRQSGKTTLCRLLRPGYTYLFYGGDQPQQRTKAKVITWQTLSEFELNSRAN